MEDVYCTIDMLKRALKKRQRRNLKWKRSDVKKISADGNKKLMCSVRKQKNAARTILGVVKMANILRKRRKLNGGKRAIIRRQRKAMMMLNITAKRSVKLQMPILNQRIVVAVDEAECQVEEAGEDVEGVEISQAVAEGEGEMEALEDEGGS